MAGQDELIYRVVYESDEASFKAVQAQLNSLSQQTAQAVEKAQLEVLKSGAGVSGLAEIQKLVRTAQSGTTGLIELSKSINATKKELSDLSAESKKNNGLTDEQLKRQIDLKTALKVTQAEYNRQEKDLITLSNAGKTAATTYNELVKQNQALSVQLRSLPLNDTSGQLQTLQKQYAYNNQKLKDFDAQMGNHQRNVGNYTNAIKEAASGLRIFGVDVGKGIVGLTEQVKASKDASGGINTMKASFQGFNQVLKANAIFLIISGIIALGNALSSVQPIMDKFSQITATLTGAFQGLLKFFQTGGDPFKLIAEGAKTAQALNKSLKDTYVLETDLIKVRAESQALVANNRELAKDESKGLMERIALLKQATDSITSVEEAEKKLAELKIEEAKKEAKLADNSREALRKVAEAEVELQNIQTRASNQRKEIAENTLTLQNKEKENIRSISEAEMQAQAAYIAGEQQALAFQEMTFRQRKDNAISYYKDEKNLIFDTADAKRKAITDSVQDEALRTAQIKAIDAQLFADLVTLETQHAETIRQIDEDTAENRIRLASLTARSIMDIAGGLQAVGLVSAKTAFKINKAASLASATIDGYKAVTSAYAQAPLGFKAATAAIVGAAAFANVAKIAATQFDSGGGTPGVQGVSGSVASSAPAIGFTAGSSPIASQVASTTVNQPAPVTNITVNNNLDRTGISTLVREGNDEISTRGVNVISKSA
jgi:chromosome segregation ATPase